MTIMRGDVHALKRMEKSERRVGKVIKTLVSKLAKTKRNQKDYKTLYSPMLDDDIFTGSVDAVPHPSLKRAQRRLSRKRIEKKRAFGVGEIVHDFETVVAIVLCPMFSGASPQLLADIVNKASDTKVTVSDGRIPLFSSADYSNGHGGLVDGTFLRIVTLQDGLSLYYISTERVDQLSKQLCINRDRYEKIQKVAAALMGAKLVTRPSHS
jgi:hypothetical protein